MPTDTASAAAAFRLYAGLSVCPAADGLWLRGPELTEDLDRELRKLPGGRRYDVDPENALTPSGYRVPTARLPDKSWRPLAEWAAPQPQPAALAGQLAARVGVRIVRADRERPAGVLVARWEAWAAYAAAAPLVRLRRLRFAAGEGRVVVWGSPLPPIPGERYVEADGIAVPAGFAWTPAVEAAVLREVIGLGAGDLALFDEAGGYERIEAANFTPATRSAVKATGTWLYGVG